MSTNTVVVIGGGVIGLSTAYHLARKKAGRIVLVEKGPVGDGSSSRAAGITSGLLWSETGVAARRIGIRWFEELSSELEGYTYHNEHGCLNLYSAEQWAKQEGLLSFYDRLGAPYEVLDAAAVRRRWPALAPASDHVGLLDPTGGYSEPPEYIAALTRRIRDLGVNVEEGRKVIDFRMDRDRVTGVLTENDVLEADAVVCAVHAWGSTLLKRLRWQIPVKYFVHQRYVTSPLTDTLAWPPVNANSHAGYIRPASGNRVLIGASTPDREEYRVESLDFHMSELATPISVRDEAAHRLAMLVPALAPVTWESEHVGLVAFSLDQEPVVGAVDQLPGLYIGASFHSGGFSYNTAVGLLLAECIVDGRTSIDISAFSANRFEDAEVDEHLAKTLRQRDMENRRH